MNNNSIKRVKRITRRYRVLFYNPYRIDDVYDYEYAQERRERRLIHYQHKIKKDSFREECRRLKKDFIEKIKENVYNVR